VRSWTVLTRWWSVAAEPIELPHDQRVAIPERLQAGGGQPGPVVPAAGGLVVVQMSGADAGRVQRVALQLGGLGSVRFGDAHVADQHPVLLVTYTFD
jgi:hypothetical protein